MAVSMQHTWQRYTGRMAKTYEAKRRVQIRWKLENEIVEEYVSKMKGSVLDCPVGSGRFLHLYKKYRLKCIGIDSSEEMLAQAKGKRHKFALLSELEIGNALELDYHNKCFDHAICIRFLDLIDEVSMHQVMRELMRVTKKTIICTIRLGAKYVPKSNTAEHDEKKFNALLKKHGWQIREKRPIFRQGWNVLQLKPQQEKDI